MIFVPLACLIAAVLMGLLNFLEMIPWRRAARVHWTERARLLYPARVSRQLNLCIIAAGLAFFGYDSFPEVPWQCVLLAGLLGGHLGNFPMDRALDPGLGFRRWRDQSLCGGLLMYSVWILTGVTAVLMPARFGWPVWVIAGLFLVVHFSLQYGFGLRVMQRLNLLRPASPRLQGLVNETCARLGIPVRATWEISWAHANAAAFVSTKELVFGDKMLAVCPDDEIKAICAHELGHISESRWVLGGRIAGTLQVFPLIFLRPTQAAYPLGFIFLLLAFAGIAFLSVKLSQKMEKRADQVAVEGIAEATVYARALGHLYQFNQIPAVMRKKSGLAHPDLYDRMLAAGLTPDYPRPEPAKGQGWTSRLTLFGLVFIIVFLGSLPG